ncbi:MAG: Sec-independent protein translocase protein TatC [Alphaproteobacteria bacterium MarineAlpha4_Bin2]|nr:MAG: Sec-independent protein translocase protein TatC [Alphaproteobacteria bacterium MarineAlpha4_Bin2]
MKEDIEEAKIPLLDHLVELRQRLLYSLVGFLVCFFLAFYFAAEIFNFLVQPLTDLWDGEESRRLIYTALQEKFITEVKVAFFTAAFIGFPLIANQIWMFVAPGLYKHEKKAFAPFLIATPVLFFIGGSFVYYFVLPVAWTFFVGFEQAGADGTMAIALEPKVNEYLSLVMRLVFAFGISFELPVVMILLARSGIVSSEGMKEKRRYAILIAFVAAAILTPPDPLSQIGLAIPIIFLYEVSIYCAKLVERGKEKRTE